jgi:hypothetical protein
LLTFHQGLVRSMGYVNHSELPLLYAVYILAASAVIDRAGNRRSPAGAPAPAISDVPLLAIAMVLCFTYTATGVSRLLLGAPTVFHPDTPTAWIAGYSYETTYHGWSVGRGVLDLPIASRALLSIGLIVVTVTELLAPCCLVSRGFRRFFLAVMIPFHLFTYVTMNILFWENLALYVFLSDFFRMRLPWPLRRDRRSAADDRDRVQEVARANAGSPAQFARGAPDRGERHPTATPDRGQRNRRSWR